MIYVREQRISVCATYMILIVVLNRKKYKVNAVISIVDSLEK